VSTTFCTKNSDKLSNIATKILLTESLLETSRVSEEIKILVEIINNSTVFPYEKAFQLLEYKL
jgi:hypothetical protein